MASSDKGNLSNCQASSPRKEVHVNKKVANLVSIHNTKKNVLSLVAFRCTCHGDVDILFPTRGFVGDDRQR